MKFTIAVVMMALAVSAQASIAPLAPLAYSLPYAAPYQYSPLSYTSRSLPLAYAAAPAIQYEYAPTLRAYPELQAYAAPALRAYPELQAYAAPALRAYPELQAYAAPAIQTYGELRSPATIIPVAAEGTYTAVNKGAIHVAPLPGHSQSASSINLESAPGTY